ncbi:MAG TPA: permease [Nitrospinota bacterium]|nr:permease [Nitrospinota bacterium]|tara:strand:- start:69520 stop:70041 length:522 start_codon:yes stop_codon:yes gene_type:complete
MKSSSILMQTGFMAAIAIVMLAIGYFRGEGQHIDGMKSGASLALYIMPLIFFAFIISSMAQLLIPKQMVVEWMGQGSQMRGLFVGSIAGALTPGGPFVCFPIALTLMKAGASVGPLVAYLSGWLTLALFRAPLEIGMLGWKLFAVRYICTLLVPPTAGLIAQMLFSNVNLSEM